MMKSPDNEPSLSVFDRPSNRETFPPKVREVLLNTMPGGIRTELNAAL
jgi:hypothetical protein